MKNAYEIRGDVVAITLRGGEEAIIDLDDLSLADMYGGTWHFNEDNSIVMNTRLRGTALRLRLANLIAAELPKQHIYPVDGDPLNCRRANLTTRLYAESGERLSNDDLLAAMAEYGGVLRSYAGRLTRDVLLQDDLIQSVWIRLWLTPPADRSEIRGWLIQTCRHRYYDHLSLASTKAAALYETDLETSWRGAEQRRYMVPEKALDWAESEATVHATLAQLPPEERSILTRFYFRDEGCEAIGATYGLTRAGGKTRLHRARLAFKQAYLSLFGEPWKEEVYAA